MSQYGDSYKSEDLGGGRVRFIVTPGTGYTAPVLAIVQGLFLGGIATAIVSPRSAIVWLFIFVIGMAAGTWGFRQFAISVSTTRRKAFKSEFVASPSGIEVTGKDLIPTPKIHRLILRNSIASLEIPYYGTVAGGTGAMGVGMAVGAGVANMTQAIAQGSKARNALTGYCLDVESGGVATTIGGGMSEPTAFGLMQDVGKALGLQ